MKTIGLIGGGQLCRMMGEEIRRKGLPFRLVALDPTPECPAAAAGVLDELLVGDFKNPERIRELGSKSDLLTFEIELAHSGVLEELESAGKPVHPSPRTLRIIQDKLDQKTFLQKKNLPVPDFRPVTGREDLISAGRDFGWPLMLKARRDSYDGRGNALVREADRIDAALEGLKGRELMVERFVDFAPKGQNGSSWHAFSGEISVIAARSTSGEIRTYPVGENFHWESILDMTRVPARIAPETAREAERVASETLRALEGAGVFCIEMFVDPDGRVLINEIAPRVHNSGHYTIEACRTSQFEQHVRAISGMPLGETTLLYAAVMVNLLGPAGLTGRYLLDGRRSVAPIPGAHLHDYGKKEVSPRRKMGHLTVVGENAPHLADELAHKARQLREFLVFKKKA